MRGADRITFIGEAVIEENKVAVPVRGADCIAKKVAKVLEAVELQSP